MLVVMDTVDDTSVNESLVQIPGTGEASNPALASDQPGAKGEQNSEGNTTIAEAEQKPDRKKPQATSNAEVTDPIENRAVDGKVNGIHRKGEAYGRQRYKDLSKNIKSDYSKLPPTDDPVAIRKQVEFYFSDSNLATDKFLFAQLSGYENLPVPVATIHSFKRMQQYQPFSAVVSALKDSTTLEIVDVVKGDNEGNKEHVPAIKRKVPLAEAFKHQSHDEIRRVIEDKAMARSIYVKGFGDEEPSTQFDIEAFFAQYGPTNQVRLRRDPYKKFKGSVFVEFDTEETQKSFLVLDPKPTYNGKELIVKNKKAYCDEKVEDINAGRIRPNEAYQLKSRKGRTDDRDWRERREEDRKNGFRGDRRRGGRGGRGHGRSGYQKDRNEERRLIKEVKGREEINGEDAAEISSKKRTLEENTHERSPTKRQKEESTTES